MLRLLRAGQTQQQNLLAAARQAPLSSPDLLTLTGALPRTPPKHFVHDYSRSELGRGTNVFLAAREALRQWQQFDLGWVQVIHPSARIAPGELVGVEAHTACFWSINFSRIVDVVDSPTLFGFLYTTTALHVEEGQERFVIELDPESESVSYLIEAVSRPRHILARIAYPFARTMQHRFAKDSHASLRRSVLQSTTSVHPHAAALEPPRT